MTYPQQLQWFLLCVVATRATEVEFPKNSFGDTFTNMAVLGGNVYIGAKNSIYILNSADLTVAQDRVSTCTGECSNINKVLLVNGKLNQLIICGTDHGGTCEIRSLTSVKDVIRRSTNTSEQELDYLVVSSNEKRPAAIVVSENGNEVYTGVTFGLGVKSEETGAFNSYFYYLSSFSVASNKYNRDKFLKVHLADPQSDTNIQLEDYVIYHKGGFEVNGFVYFVTNQKFKAGDTHYISKLIRVCQNDTNPLLDRNQNSFFSYTDIKLECRKDGSIYNLIQDVTVFEPGEELGKSLNSNEKIMAATFASGSNPESPELPSAVCLYRIEAIDQKIMEAKRNFITCPDNRLSEKESYLSNHLLRCINNSKYSEEDVKCNKELSVLTYIIGDEASSLSAQAVYTVNHSDNHGYLGKIKASTTGKYTVLYTGTSAGKMIKLNVNSKEAAEVFEVKPVDQGHPITGIQVENDGKIQYVMSDRMIVRYEMTDCDQYTTCESAMEARNPLCGWCVYKNKTTFKENSSCPYQSYDGHWLSSLTQCLSLDVVPKGVAVAKTVRVNISVKDSLPQQFEGDIYECRFKIGRGEGISPAVYETDTGMFECKTDNVVDHTDGKLEFFVEHSGEKILLAETDFLFFDCDHYKKCGDCTGDDRASCSWDSFNTRCVSKNTSSDLLIQQKDSCPKFQNDDRYYIPSDVTKTLTFRVENLVNSSDIQYFCRLNDSKKVAAVKQDVNQINCTLEAITTISEEMYTIEILYGRSEAAAAPLDGTNTVVVYNCSQLGRDCSFCRSLKYKNEAYKCGWCSANCIYSTDNCSDPCPAPSVTKVVPSTSGIKGNITVTVQGRELGSRVEEVDNITLAGELCQPQPGDFIPSKQVTCLAGESAVKEGHVSVVVNNQRSTGNVMFSYKIPQITEVVPAKGPKAGGTRLSIKGTDLGIGTRIVSAYVKDQAEKKKECSNAKVEPSVPVGVKTSAVFHIECDTPAAEVGTMLESIEIIFDGGSTVHKAMNFTYLTNPEIKDILPLKAIQSGANPLRVTGKYLLNAHKGYITGDGETTHCRLNSETEMICPSPKLSKKHVQELMKKLNSSRKKRAADSDASISVEIIVHLDGVKQTFSIWYYSDPSFSSFEDDNQVKLFDSATQKLTIKGEKLNLVAVKDDVNVTIGVDNCDVIELTSDNLTCVAPTNQPAPNVPGQSLPEVNVSIGNVHDTVGYLKYFKVDKPDSVETWLIGAIIGCLLALVVIIALPFIWKYRQKSRESKDYKAFQKDVEERETEMRQIFREEFADMHTSMSVVSNSLIEQGCPYHHYQQYVFKVMFPADTEIHPLLQEPVVSSKFGSKDTHEEQPDMATSSTPLLEQVTDQTRSKMRRGMEEFESLIFNKYFLTSVIYSLEKQKKFKTNDIARANMCGYLCTILLGRMEYLQEVLVDLLGTLIEESAGKKNQRVLFRWSDTVTKKLLSNWLSLCLYPHLKSQSGYPLYLLYKATQLHMEAGPIDAIYNHAKYTLSEEKLLKKYSQHSKQGSDEPTFEAKCLTLNVVVDNCRDIKVCRVLDCDTITQVKEKCLTQIYVNYPASNLTVKPEELELEWHAGMSGSLRLRDKDNTSKRHGDWVRLNTLAHYNVQDGSNMALIDPQVADAAQEQDYANLAQIQVSCPSDCSMDSTDAATASLVVPDSDDHNLKYWHMVKQDEGTLTPGNPKSLMTELYLNRLLKFKQSILEYILAIYDTVLRADTVPPHVHFFYHLLDELAEKNNIESDTVHAWKSKSYPERIWANLMKQPSMVFDIKSPPYVDDSMDVISQVFIECFSLKAHKLSRDSPAHKVIFTSEMNQYMEKVKQFYKEISVSESQPDNLRKYLEEVNKLQQQHTSFNKMSALHKLYGQIEPYITEVIDDLSTNRDACRLHLDKKLEQVNGLMAEED